MENGWVNDSNCLVKIFTFRDFSEAVSFVNKIVPLAEKINHHPDIEIFSYKNVKVKLTTHEKGTVTEKDIQLSKEINNLTT